MCLSMSAMRSLCGLCVSGFALAGRRAVSGYGVSQSGVAEKMPLLHASPRLARQSDIIRALLPCEAAED